MDAAFVLYEQMTALDLVGPYEMLAANPEITPHFIAERHGPVRADAGLQFNATATFAELPRPDLIVVPGSSRWRSVLESSDALVAWLAAAHPTATWTTSVCTGATLLAKAGILKDRPATTHWLARDVLAELGASVSSKRVIVDGDVVTAAGVSAGLDMGLTLVAELFDDDRAKLIQLVTEYDPQPPFDTGSVEKAPAALVDFARQYDESL
ncbi:DJ-1/PfpI family protein [Actinomadura barringtoniae]|uniref:DJ-1/PfpI family protein n=1 Tax=Actinomadura barringtoniae TaxID=1427535 RepID=A0A939T4W3_9ACTN|nr:DJ-1/PfpI family protein [Actinomadura barringtoniae]MBO2453036.1 DJ-1/PfpI family protein [Actinomadura barringtoniae]